MLTAPSYNDTSRLGLASLSCLFPWTQLRMVTDVNVTANTESGWNQILKHVERLVSYIYEH